MIAVLRRFCNANGVDFDENDEAKEDDGDGRRCVPAQYRPSRGGKRKLWLIVNPFSGTAQGEVVWNGLIKPFLDWNRDTVEYIALMTEKQFHAQNVCLGMTKEELEVYDGIVTLG